MSSIHPLDRWRRSLQRTDVLGRGCWMSPAEGIWDEHQDDWGPAEILLTRCVLHLTSAEAEEDVLPYLYGGLDDEGDDDQDEEDDDLDTRAFQACWREPIETLLVGAETLRCPPDTLWAVGTEVDSMMDPYDGYAAEAFDASWALVTQDPIRDFHGPLRIPLGLVPRDDVARLAPLLVARRNVDWGFTGRDTEIPFLRLYGEDVDVYRLLLAVTGVSDEVLALPDDALLVRQPRHPEGGWGIDDVRALVD